MITDQTKLRELMSRPVQPALADELRRDGNLFFVGGELAARETLETIFDSHCQVPAELFHLTFGGLDTFHLGEELARQIKKNFNTHLVGRLDYPAPAYILERAYAAGVDILDLPLRIFDPALARERGLELDRRLAVLEAARAVFPRWSVASTLMAGEEPPCVTCRGIDSLLAAGIVPLVEVTARAAGYPADEMAALFSHLAAGWKKHKVVIQPFQPLVGAMTPLVAARRAGVLRGFIDKVYDRQLLVTSDLRRSLRMKQVEQSFESAGL